MKVHYLLGGVALVGGAALFLTMPGQTQTAGSFVALQATSGTPQPGFVNITESVRAKQIVLFQPGTSTAAYANNAVGTGNGFYNQNFTDNYPGLIGFVYQDTNAGVWAFNNESSTETFLCYGYNGVQTRGGATGAGIQATAGSNNLAGNFFGDVNVSLQMQAGSANLLGRGGLNTLTMYTPADGLNAINSLSDSAYPGIASRSTNVGTAAIYAWNTGTNSEAILAYGNNGIVANGTGSGYAGIFNGRVITGYLSVNTGGAPAYPLDLAQPSADTNVAGARILSDGQGDAVIHPGGSYWRAGLEAAGANGIIGGTSRPGGYGVLGLSATTRGVYGFASDSTAFNYGVVGQTSSSTNGYGVYSFGRTGATGTKSFVIDHPLDPENKYLAHYCTEGEEPLNVYRGKITTDAKGFATVTLPDYYESINIDPTVQLTVEDEGDDFIMAKVASKVADGQFRIRTSRGGTLVYWRLEARRNDRFVSRYGAPNEIEKPADRKGTYQHPELYGFGDERREGLQRISASPGVPRSMVLSEPILRPKVAGLSPRRNDKPTPHPKKIENGTTVSLGR